MPMAWQRQHDTCMVEVMVWHLLVRLEELVHMRIDGDGEAEDIGVNSRLAVVEMLGAVLGYSDAIYGIQWRTVVLYMAWQC